MSIKGTKALSRPKDGKGMKPRGYVETSDKPISRKKTRCSGNQPCNLCTSAGLVCEFTAAYRRGKIPPITTEKEQPNQQGAVSENAGSSANIEHGHVIEIAKPFPEYHNAFQSPLTGEFGTIPHDVAVAASTLARLQPGTCKDTTWDLPPEPHFSFVYRKNFIKKSSFSHNSSIFTFGDAPLPDYDPSFFVLPPKPDAKNLVARYFDFAVPTHRFLHRPTLEAWVDEFYDNLGTFQRKGGAKGRTALLFMVFAQAKDYMPGVDRANDVDTRKRVFWCAYTLDNYLSAALGRPRTFHDDDIDQELPSCVNDSDLTSRHVHVNKSRAQSIMMAPIAHAMLSQIISNILRDLYSILPPPSTFTHYFAFCAVVVLYVYTIQTPLSAPRRIQQLFEAAARCHSQISSRAKNESLAQRYSVVLEELRLEAITNRQEQRKHYGPQTTQTPGSIDGADGEYLESSPSVTMDPLTSWGEFDSLVTGGVAGLDFLFTGEQNEQWEMGMANNSGY
ncbi:hypothetical protein DID88_000448 [Monilinia fructigena]|uniref:Xylanolytic transcriptional activator regulatory domain-containing protein n=1 Tax=Monilinia fructigena TaxID=38457 RepID=A0A395IN61_9HELO|nr:hypothetical protein DID88_000448 [Monilinia fructigena]